ncbi:hypothetical protein PanWU01x14_069240 [Parasponia andersonii]|uniref:Uncharacterized protein n=1 Tax=Parasponia andersonii TaxID=3476 RepID=A0A2P5DFL1_PARAD|nr:hypothetical protein PanWU01x14_069240 [Parasponia andersonii]
MRVTRDTTLSIRLSEVRAEPITDSGQTWPSPTLTSIAGGSEAPKAFHQNTIESNPQLQTQTEHLMRS